MKERDRAKYKGIHNRLYESEGLKDRIIAEIQGFQRAEDNLNHRIEDLGILGYKIVQLVASDINDSRSFCGTSTATETYEMIMTEG